MYYSRRTAFVQITQTNYKPTVVHLTVNCELIKEIICETSVKLTSVSIRIFSKMNYPKKLTEV
jgi:hypothetical protein